MNNEFKKKYIQNAIPLSSFTINSFLYDDYLSIQNPNITEKLQLQLNKYANNSQNRMIIPLNPIGKIKDNFPKIESRVSDIIIRRTECYIDSVQILIPQNLKLETLPADKNIQSVYGNYKTTIKIHANTITYIRILNFNKGNYPKEKYTDFLTFINQVKQWDNANVVFLKQ